ncbi:FixH family protein [Flavihumibacter fluvii]|uniref:FixH family protein n=1 Tax=Flavihumibacter fluvii TaxID=2838157 RepID=UPI001BDEB274|nr:FixH family protein [Flavihumibacter fluvii]ULQ50830.1 FixH family protein [Flavihumibacter fluvii]
MTFNFGHKLLLVFILFGILMFYLVYQSLHTNFELVSKDYYKDELAYQQVIDATNNANELASKSSITQKGDDIYLQLPAEMANQAITGIAYFYCAADSKKDRTIALAPDAAGLQVISVGKELTHAAYRVRITWTANDKKYYQDSYLQVN